MSTPPSPPETPDSSKARARRTTKKPTRRRKKSTSSSADGANASPPTSTSSSVDTTNPSPPRASRIDDTSVKPATSTVDDAAPSGDGVRIGNESARVRGNLEAKVPNTDLRPSGGRAGFPDNNPRTKVVGADVPSAGARVDGSPDTSPASSGEAHNVPKDAGIARGDTAVVTAGGSSASSDASRHLPSGTRVSRMPRLRPRSLILLAMALIIAACIVALIYMRWFFYDDAHAIQGTWRIDAAHATMVFTADEIKLLQGVVYEYDLDPWSKTMSFSFSNLEGQAGYYFGDGGQVLVITEGEQQPNLFMQLGLMENPAVADDSSDDEVIVLHKLSDDTDTTPQSLANNTTEAANTFGAAIVDGRYNAEESTDG